jgi:hypothetical protein
LGARTCKLAVYQFNPRCLWVVFQLANEVFMNNLFERRKGYYKGKYLANWQVITGFLLAVIAVILMSGGPV